ncbi:MAG: hypothetical protein EBY95_07010 [Actinobacteria bacterium]|nr:hypothetical protein [Actinomycetota bacterium]
MALLVAVLGLFLVGVTTAVGLRRRPVAGAVVGLAVFLAGVAATLVEGVGADAAPTATVKWLSGLGLDLHFSLDGFGVLMSLIVLVLGFAVLTYAIAYFEHDETFARFVGVFLAFAGSMTGVVIASDLFTMFVFWELTSICSFLLIGLNDKSDSARQAAVRALLTTGAGGLCLLGAVALLQIDVGTTQFSDLAALQLICWRTPCSRLVSFSELASSTTISVRVRFHDSLKRAQAYRLSLLRSSQRRCRWRESFHSSGSSPKRRHSSRCSRLTSEMSRRLL